MAVTYEDRESAIPGILLLALSLARRSPQIGLTIYTPLSGLSGRIGPLANVTVEETTDLKGKGWNVKPTILQRSIARFGRVLWLDTDIVVLGDLARLDELAAAPGTLLVGQEYNLGDGGGGGGRLRAEAFGWTMRRELDCAVNSGSILADESHLPLMALWSEALASEAYQKSQKLPVADRPPAHVGDQDVLWALLVSSAAEVKVVFAETGRLMLQHCGANGYSVRDRLRHAFGHRAVFVHMLGRYKPWDFREVPARHTEAYRHFVAYELSPFFRACLPYRKALGNPEWLRTRSAPAWLFKTLTLNHPSFQGLPLALAAAARTKFRPE